MFSIPSHVVGCVLGCQLVGFLILIVIAKELAHFVLLSRHSSLDHSSCSLAFSRLYGLGSGKGNQPPA
jgi:hypothetical protein